MVHGVLYALSWSVPAGWVPQIRLDHLLQLLQVEALDDREFAEIIGNIEHYRWWIVGYMLCTSLLGLGAGYETGSLIVRGPLRRLAEHAWVYDLRVEGGSDRPPGLTLKLVALVRRLWGLLPAAMRAGVKQAVERLGALLSASDLRTVTVAYVLTDIAHEQRYLIYRGFLKAFGISKEGKPLYLVLSNTMRSYMVLAEFAPRTSSTEGWYLIGTTSETATDLPGPRLSSYLTVSGDHINNAVFDRHVFRQTPAGLRRLETVYAESILDESEEGLTP